MHFKKLRVVVGLICVILWTLLTCPLVIVLGLALRLLSPLPPFSLLWSIIQWFPTLWSFVVWNAIGRFMLCFNMNIPSLVRPINDGLVVFVANHPTYIGFLGYGYYVTCVMRKKITMVMKHELKWSFSLEGILAKTLWAIGAAVFIDRSNGKSAQEKIRAKLMQERDSRVIAIFPDGSRPTQQRIDENHEKNRELSVIGAFTETLVPRPTGTMTIWEVIRGSGVPVQFIAACMGFDRADEGLSSAADLIGATYLVSSDDFTDAVVDLRTRDQWKAWMIRLFVMFNQMQRSWRRKMFSI